MHGEDRIRFIERIRATFSPLASTEPDAALGDLQSLASIVGNGRIVGLGENWHSTKQLLRIKHRLARFLVERLGFNVVVFEGSLPGAPVLDRYVDGRGGDAKEALRALGQAMWLNGETLAFVEWLRSWNQGAASVNKVRVFGMDSIPATAAMADVPAYLDRAGPEWALPHRDGIRTIEKLFAEVPLDSLSRAAIWGAGEVYDRLSESEREEMRLAFTGIVARLEQHRATYASRTSPGEFEWALRESIVVLQAWDILAARSHSLRAATERRAFAFAENIAWIRRQVDPSARIIVLAHNIHVARQPFLSFDSDVPVTSMGGRLAELFPGEYVAIGAAVGSGKRSGGDAGLANAYLQRDAVRANGDESIDAALEALDAEAFIVPMPGGVPSAQAMHPMRSHLNPSTGYAPAVAFDALAYADQITAATPL